ncbi:hypothetical protein B0H10DRAFT_1794648, partial [Mycena sp. CBHHK59/15]
WRTRGYKFTLEDYYEYQHHCKTLLAQPRARAAFLAGGIVWRIAWDILSPDIVFGGPSIAAIDYQIGACMANTNTWDDVLTENELDLICGMHKVTTGNLNRETGVEQTANKSWWPSHSTWAGLRCGNNPGYWSYTCEKWYQERLSEIEAGKATPLTSSDWR